MEVFDVLSYLAATLSQDNLIRHDGDPTTEGKQTEEIKRNTFYVCLKSKCHLKAIEVRKE